MEYCKKLKADNFHIYSLACDDTFGFGIFAMWGFGDDQKVIRLSRHYEDYEDYEDALLEHFIEDYSVTACGARYSTFFFVMTKGAEGYDDKLQSVFTGNTWADTKKKIGRESKKGKIITSICYSTDKEEYLVVMTESYESQNFRWSTGNEEDQKWENEEKAKGRRPNIIFKDPTDGRLLIVATSDEQYDKSGAHP